MDSTIKKFDRVRDALRDKRVLIAFSGGVDSTALAIIASDVAEYVKLLTIASEVSATEIDYAKSLSKELGIDHDILSFKWLEHESLITNPKNRCYLCKSELAKLWSEYARQHNFEIIVEGTNASDIDSERPGLAALKENNIRSPFLEADITKKEIRGFLQQRCPSVAHRPSMSCLATRIPYGVRITSEMLAIVEELENIIQSVFGVKMVRARIHGNLVRIEVGHDEKHLLFDTEKLDSISDIGKSLGFDYITFDSYGYKTGSMD